MNHNLRLLRTNSAEHRTTGLGKTLLCTFILVSKFACCRVFGILDGHGGRQSANFVKAALPTELATQQKLFIEQQLCEASGVDEKFEQMATEQGQHSSPESGEDRSAGSADKPHLPEAVSDYEMRRVSRHTALAPGVSLGRARLYALGLTRP